MAQRDGRAFGAIVLAGIVVLLLAAYFLFPAIYRGMQRQYCVASGATNCQ